MSEFNIEDLDVLIARSRESSLVQMLALQLKRKIRKCEQMAADNEKAMESLKQADAAVKLAYEKFSALADENMALKSGHYNGMVLPESPATDAFLAEVRASARNDFIGRIEWIIRNECNPDKTEEIINELQNFSDELKLEAAQ